MVSTWPAPCYMVAGVVSQSVGVGGLEHVGQNYNWSVMLVSLYALWGPALWFQCEWWFSVVKKKKGELWCSFLMPLMTTGYCLVGSSKCLIRLCWFYVFFLCELIIDLHPRMVGSLFLPLCNEIFVFYMHFGCSCDLPVGIKVSWCIPNNLKGRCGWLSHTESLGTKPS